MITVLYLDDCPHLLNVVQRYLERHEDILVETSLFADDAFRKITSRRYDIVVMDYNLKEKPGIDLLVQVRDLGIQTPFVFFTLEYHPVREQAAKLFKGVGFVRKFSGSPSAMNDLERIIRKRC